MTSINVVISVCVFCGIYVGPQFGMNPEPVRGSVTANIGWYVVPILHDQPSCNIDIT